MKKNDILVHTFHCLFICSLRRKPQIILSYKASEFITEQRYSRKPIQRQTLQITNSLTLLSHPKPEFGEKIIRFL